MASNWANLEGDASRLHNNQSMRAPTPVGYQYMTPGSGHSFASRVSTGQVMHGTLPISFSMSSTLNASSLMTHQVSAGNVSGLNVPTSYHLEEQGVTGIHPNVANGTFGVSMYPVVMANGSFAP